MLSEKIEFSLYFSKGVFWGAEERGTQLKYMLVSFVFLFPCYGTARNLRTTWVRLFLFCVICKTFFKCQVCLSKIIMWFFALDEQTEDSVQAISELLCICACTAERVKNFFRFSWKIWSDNYIRVFIKRPQIFPFQWMQLVSITVYLWSSLWISILKSLGFWSIRMQFVVVGLTKLHAAWQNVHQKVLLVLQSYLFLGGWCVNYRTVTPDFNTSWELTVDIRNCGFAVRIFVIFS